MNPQYSETPGLHLPQPGTTPAPSAGGFVSQPLMPAPPATPASAAPTPTPQVLAQANPTPAEVISDEGSTSLDEEWVAKAKEVTTRLKADPYLQAKELNKLKAQYLKVRYNKDVKVSEDK